MVAEHRLCHILVLAASLLLSFSILLRAQQQIYNSTASLSSSWINHLTTTFKDQYGNLFTPILVRSNNEYSFICGFYCGTSIFLHPVRCIFGVLIISPNRNGSIDMPSAFPQVVWSVNRNNPVRDAAALRLGQDGDLVLANSNGTLVWSSNTTGKSVAGMNLTESGNLVFFGKNGEPIWQSFDYPTDCLLLGQKLSPGQRLTASVSESNWSEGLFYFSNDHKSLAAYVKSDPPQRYYFYQMAINPYYVEFKNGSFRYQTFPPTSAAQVLKFGPDGHLKVYQWVQWGGSGWTEVADLLKIYIGDCVYPMVCGNYGVCSAVVVLKN